MRLIKLLAIILFFLMFYQDGQAQFERGTLPIKIYANKDYNGEQQVFDITTDSRGVIYAGNAMGLLELSGNTWKVYQVENMSKVRAIAIDSLGRIFIGAQGEFGYLDVDSNHKGILTYHILSDRIKEKSDADFSDVKFVTCFKNKVYFQTKSKIFIWDYKNLKVIDSKSRISDFFFISGQLFTTILKKGYYRIDRDSLVSVYNSENKDLAANVIPYDNKNSLFFSKRKGFYLVNYQEGRFHFEKKFHTQIDSLFSKLSISVIKRISPNLFAIGSSRGVFILDNNGRLERLINKTTGLKSNRVTALSLGKDNRLWIATEDGIAVASVFSAIEYFPHKKCNYDGRILNIRRFDNNIYIITTSGLHVLNKSIQEFPKQFKLISELDELCISKFQPYVQKHKQQISNLSDTLEMQLTDQCWGLSKFKLGNKRLLLVATSDYIVGINPNGKLEKLAGCYPYVSYQSKVDPRRVYIGLDGGVQSVYYSKNGKWIDEGVIDGVNEIIVDIAEDTLGNLWLASMQKGVVKINQPVFENHKIKNPKIFKLKKGLDSESLVMIGLVDNELCFPGSFGVYSFLAKDSSFQLNPIFGDQINNKRNIVFDLSQDPYKNVWVISIEDSTQIRNVYYLKKSAENNYHNQKAFAIKGEMINDFYHDPNNITWFGGTNGLYKVKAAGLNQGAVSYNAYITMVLSNADTAFGGYYETDEGVSLSQPESYIRTFDYKHNSFTFNFSAASPVDLKKLKYSWYLEGYDKERSWGAWSDKTYKEYTNLDEGNYTFHVKAEDVYGNISNESSYQFSVKPPWYRTIWAFFGYVLFFIAFVWGAIRVSTRSLKRIIKEATAEIMEQKDQLEEKNRNIIDSIRYAQRIQEAVIPSDSQFHHFFNDSFILWKPRDIVSGDFYWMMRRDKQLFVCAADCTGHGVPGAFMSIMGISFLNQIAGMPDVKNAADALNMLRSSVITSLNKEGSQTATKDGMDIALCVFDMEQMQVDFAGAYNPLYIIRDGELLETKADRMPIGVHDRDNVPFSNKTVELVSGDQIYMFSDGYIDQFGGPKGKKFMSKRFKRLLLEISELSMEEQKERLWKNVLEWRGEIEQVDDIIILGIRIQ